MFLLLHLDGVRGQVNFHWDHSGHFVAVIDCCLCVQAYVCVCVCVTLCFDSLIALWLRSGYRDDCVTRLNLIKAKIQSLQAS